MKANADPPTSAEQILEQHIATFFRIVRQLSLPAEFVRERVAQWLASPPPDHFLLIDPDAGPRDILLTEIHQLTSWPASRIPIEGCARSEKLRAAVPLCRPSKQNAVRSALPNDIELFTLQIRSAHTWLTPWLLALNLKLVGIVSHWPDFLEIARTVLIAVGIAADVLLLRDALRPRWNRGLDQTGAIICDAYTAATRKLPADALSRNRRPRAHPRYLSDLMGHRFKKGLYAYFFGDDQPRLGTERSSHSFCKRCSRCQIHIEPARKEAFQYSEIVG